jgi:hypothetical protein
VFTVISKTHMQPTLRLEGDFFSFPKMDSSKKHRGQSVAFCANSAKEERVFSSLSQNVHAGLS